VTTTAVDTNVLLDVLAANPPFVEASGRALLEARHVGAVVVSEMVYAELAAAFRGDQERLQEFLGDMAIRLLPSPQQALAEGGRIWRAYRDAGGPRNRILADFLIGAHAQARSDRLLTRDRGFFRRWFEDLEIVDPSRAAVADGEGARSPDGS
jgi:predicted nucleic acid-binding protein